MNSILYKITNPWGLHARPSVCVAAVTTTCANDWEVVATVRGREADAKSIMGLMKLTAAAGSEIEFFSLMPDDQWGHFTASLESLFYCMDVQGNKTNSYSPTIDVITKASKQDYPLCTFIQCELLSESTKHNCAPFFERIDDYDTKSHGSSSNLHNKATTLFLEETDVFISYDSKDFSYAIRIYDALLDRGIKVFLAGVSLPSTGTTDFQLAIEQALANTKSMVVVATDPTHLEGGWVRAEWTTFLNEKRTGRKPGNLITVRPHTLSITDLPVMLRMYQSEEVSESGPFNANHVDRLIQFLNIASET